MDLSIETQGEFFKNEIPLLPEVVSSGIDEGSSNNKKLMNVILFGFLLAASCAIYYALANINIRNKLNNFQNIDFARKQVQNQTDEITDKIA